MFGMDLEAEICGRCGEPYICDLYAPDERPFCESCRPKKPQTLIPLTYWNQNLGSIPLNDETVGRFPKRTASPFMQLWRKKTADEIRAEPDRAKRRRLSPHLVGRRFGRASATYHDKMVAEVFSRRGR